VSPHRPGGGDDGPDRPGDTPVGRGEDPVDVDAAWADIVARWGEPAADRGAPSPGRASVQEPGAGTDGPTEPTTPRGPDAGPADDDDDDDQSPAGPGAPAAGARPPTPEPGGVPGRRVLRGSGDERPAGSSSEADAPTASGGLAGWADADAQGTAWRGGPGTPEPDDDHYVPPEPPRAPPSDTVTRLAWLGALAGPALLLLCALVWRDAPTLVVAAAVAAFVLGFGVLVARLPRSRDDDDGAVV